jgi:hypothetical protein
LDPCRTFHSQILHKEKFVNVVQDTSRITLICIMPWMRKKQCQMHQRTSKEHNNNNNKKKKKKNVYIPASVELLTATQKSCRGAGS